MGSLRKDKPLAHLVHLTTLGWWGLKYLEDGIWHMFHFSNISTCHSNFFFSKNI